MNQFERRVCIVLPYPPSYSETFVKAHVEKLSATVNYVERFPVSVDIAYPDDVSHGQYGMLTQKLKSNVHRYALNPTKILYLRKFFRSRAINVVLAEFGESGVAALDICKKLQIPMVVHFHGSDAYSKARIERHRSAYKKMFAYASAVIAVSRHMAERLVELGAPRSKVVYNPYGIEIGKFKPASCLKPRSQVLAVGRFVEKKAPYLTILAFKQVLERLPGVRLVMAGGGELYDVCRQIIRSLHIENAVELRGVVNHDEIAELMRQSTVFAQHSLVPMSGDTEGTPVAILEAGASGLPIISTRHAGIVDAVIHGKTGFLVEEGDIDGMARHMQELLSNPRLAADMGKHARAHISTNFNVDNSIQKLRDILDSSIAEAK